MTGGGEAAHIGANFRGDDLSGQFTDARDAAQQANRLPKRVKITVHFGVDFSDGDSERGHLPQMHA
jgi:hypothetical protein